MSKLLVCISFVVLVMMGHLDFFYVEAKAFEIQSEERFGGIRSGERSRGTYRAVILGKSSVMWLRSTVEELIRGTKLREFNRLVRCGSTIYVALRCANDHGRFLELSKYGLAGGEAS